MDHLQQKLLRLMKRCRKSQIAYASAAHFCTSANLIALFKAHGLARKGYQKVLSACMDQMGRPLYKSRNIQVPFYQFSINFLNWLNAKNEMAMLNKCLRADKCLCTAYEDLLDGAEVTDDLIEKLRQQYQEVRKAIQELTIAKETAKH